MKRTTGLFTVVSCGARPAAPGRASAVLLSRPLGVVASFASVRTAQTTTRHHHDRRSHKNTTLGIAALVSGCAAIGGYTLYNQNPFEQRGEASQNADSRSKFVPPIAEGISFKPRDSTVLAEELVVGAPKRSPVPFAMRDAEGRPNIYKVCLTGGPCGGKSTALSILSQRLNSLGFQVYGVPEAATILFTGGGRFSEWDLQKEIAFEENKIKTQMALEEAFYALAKASGKPSVLICDRGTVDSRAYIADETWNLLLNKTGWSVVALRDKQYDVVLHLISAAIGAEKFYQTLNNPTRSETLEEARALDVRILNAWVGHPRLFVIDNSTDFKGKMERVMDVLCRQVGVKSSATLHKLLVKNPDAFHNLPVKCEEFDVEQTFLLKTTDNAEAGYVFVQKRGQHGNNTYRYSTKLMFGQAEAAIVERQISGLEYHTLTHQADPAREVVKKKVKCFLWNNKYYELDYYLSPHPGLVLMYTDEVTAKEADKMPPFIQVARDVTFEPSFSSFTLAKKEKP